MTQAQQPHPAFESIRSEHIDSLNLQVEQFKHSRTGAMHYHLASENNENVFLVALRTVPHDSTGVAHILEHTALCGSERFPVRDPFFMMLRRSLNTFMNAFTSSDWTAYPFASQNRKDFGNLLDVYLDAVFFSRLDPMDFAQEGHRLEFADPKDPNSELVFKGVVFNEMKGAMSSIASTLWQTLCSHLFPSTTYHYNSGGDPEAIPDLDYQQLQNFYRSHYHPSNAIFMTFGDIPATEHHSVFEERALHRFESLDEIIAVPLEKRLNTPLKVTESYAFDDAGGTDNKTHIVLAWLLGESTDLEQLLEAQLLSSVLLDNSASPLQQLLETSDLGQAPSPLCGLEDSMRELVFVCGLEGSEAEHADLLEQQILSVVEETANNGVEFERLDAVLHQLELAQREVSGDSYPYGLQLILTALGCATHYSDPIAVLNLDPVLETLRDRIQNPDYIKGLAQSLLLDNKHRVRLVMTPDQQLSSQRQQAEASRLANIKADLSDDDKQGIVVLARKLADRQEQTDDESILPKVGLEDVPAQIPDLSPTLLSKGSATLTTYKQGTNGIVYQQALAPLPDMDAKLQALLPYYSNALTELGLGEQDYLTVQDRQSATCGSINAFTNMRSSSNDVQKVSAYLVMSSKALRRNQQAQTQLMRDTLERVRFDELDRLRELVSQQRARREQSVTGNGHGLAIAAACAGMSPSALLGHQLSGLEGIRTCKSLDESLKDSSKLEQFAANLAELHERVLNSSFQFLTIADGDEADPFAQQTLNLWQGFAGTMADHASFSPAPIRESRREIWVTNTQVNFCAQAFPTVAMDHPDAAALTILGGFLRNGFLHRAIREQGGAYGGGASQDSNTGSFRFFSYRDPRMQETISDFGASVEWMLNEVHSSDLLEQAILGVISTLDKPSSPAGEAKQHFHNSLFGHDHLKRTEFRQRILDQKIGDLYRVTKTYLVPESASTAIVTSQSGLDQTHNLVEELGLTSIQL